MLISFQIRQNEESDDCYEMKAVWRRNWMSTNLVRDWNKNTEPRGGKMGVVQVLHVYHRRNNDSTTQRLRDSGHISRFSFVILPSVSNKVEQNFISKLFFCVIFSCITHTQTCN